MQKKKLLIMFAVCSLLLVLAGCGGQDAEKPKESVGSKAGFLTVENYPVMDGSTANLPLMAEVMSKACAISNEEAENLTTCTTTPMAWNRLVSGEADILLVYEAAEATQKEVEASGVKLEITPIGSDALVFINNDSNPVKSLTSQNLKDIYTGKITNWNQVGGKDTPIVAYQRSEDSGSQALFAKLLMGGTKAIDAPTELRPGAMGELIDDLASYNNDASALGYSVYYYAKNMYQQPGLKFLAINDIIPSDETIADKTYPYTNNFFVAIRADEPKDSPARILRDWIISPDGTEAIKAAGYVSVN